jgi:hypothetical protein
VAAARRGAAGRVADAACCQGFASAWLHAGPPPRPRAACPRQPRSVDSAERRAAAAAARVRDYGDSGASVGKQGGGGGAGAGKAALPSALDAFDEVRGRQGPATAQGCSSSSWRALQGPAAAAGARP